MTFNNNNTWSQNANSLIQKSFLALLPESRGRERWAHRWCVLSTEFLGTSPLDQRWWVGWASPVRAGIQKRSLHRSWHGSRYELSRWTPSEWSGNIFPTSLMTVPGLGSTRFRWPSPAPFSGCFSAGLVMPSCCPRLEKNHCQISLAASPKFMNWD